MVNFTENFTINIVGYIHNIIASEKYILPMHAFRRRKLGQASSLILQEGIA